ncbi:class I SAM-dependent methyltransferase [Salidesulfovibrio onnuriiensis]|uniref:class I SAM-dependent methyltransferase n=1 Tax=Salidesulfovibrio onnuriiensis TaxID=2583823 RepID=UPI0011CA621A|nr:class I SAM-dependent methyltransferase [Salidesulfovibrio onnuriiensis]
MKGSFFRSTTHVCDYKHQRSFDNWLRGLLHPPQEVLGGWVKPGMTVIDAGCGIGYFSLGMAEIVGPGGRVVAVDMQEGALARLEERAEKAGLTAIIETHKCEADQLGPLPKADFAMAFWMVHETPDAGAFFRQLHAALNKSACMLFTEPPLHVSKNRFREEIAMAEQAGFRFLGQPKIRFCNAALFEKQ